MSTPAPCYYCSRPEGAPHLPECPKAPAAARFIEAQAKPTPEARPATRDEIAEQWHAAHKGHIGYSVTGTCTHIQVAS